MSLWWEVCKECRFGCSEQARHILKIMPTARASEHQGKSKGWGRRQWAGHCLLKKSIHHFLLLLSVYLWKPVSDDCLKKIHLFTSWNPEMDRTAPVKTSTEMEVNFPICTWTEGLGPAQWSTPWNTLGQILNGNSSTDQVINFQIIWTRT